MEETERDRQALSMLCADLPELRAECAEQSAWHVTLLSRIECEAAARRPILDLLAELAGGTQDEVLEDHRLAATGLPGFGGGRADDEWFGCPDGACDRTDRPAPAGAPPPCLLTGREMRRL